MALYALSYIFHMNKINIALLAIKSLALFEIWIYMPSYAGPPPPSGHTQLIF